MIFSPLAPTRGRYGRTPADMEKAVEAANEIKARRAAQATVLHATPGAAGHNFKPIHLRVFQAGQNVPRANGGAD